MKIIFPFYSIGHFINQPENPTEFEILRFEEIDEPNVDDIHKHTFYEIIWTEHGKSKQTIDYKEYEILPNSLFFISPNQVHKFEEWQPLIGGSILFSEEFFLFNQLNKQKLFELSFLDNLYMNPCIQLKSNEFEDILNTINLMDKENKRSDRSRNIIQSLLHILMEQIQRLIDKSAERIISKKYLLLFKEFKSLIEIYFLENKTSIFYSEKLNITQHHLNVVSKHVTGKTSGEIIKARSILEAKRLLTFTDQAVSEIAFQLNYTDSSYFIKTFKSETNQTPTQFKNQMSEKYHFK